MIVELKGLNIKNKGAHLMLKAIVKKVQERYPDATFVAERGYGFSTKDMASQGIKRKFRTSGHSKNEKIIRLIPRLLRKALGIITTQDVDVVLDGSGFIYSDEWPVGKINSRLVYELDIFKNNQAKVILMPQAFGPFNQKETRESLSTITTKADLVFARDNISYKHLTQAFGEKQNIIQAPDFTNLLKPNKAAFNTQSYENSIMVIPNFKMNTLKGQDVKEIYFNFLQNSIQFFQQVNEKVFFLNHEGELDQAIAEEVNKRLAMPIEIIRLEDPLHIKAVIGVAKIVITSRFHGLVSSLSQGIPTLCTSWSHKYQMLMDEYQQGDYLIDILHIKDKDLENLLKLFHVEANLNHIRNVLATQSKHFHSLSEQMWVRVFDCIDRN